MMSPEQQDAYEAAVEQFMRSEGINCLSCNPDCEPYFGKQPCECCGSRLYGDRHQAKGYSPSDHAIYDYSICADCVVYAEYGTLTP